MNIADIRKDYRLMTLEKADLSGSPFDQFSTWWQHAIHSEIDEVNAMTLATAHPDGTPDARIVLLKGLSEKGFLFFTNYQSQKGQELAANPKACLVFFWKELQRQVRVYGRVEKASSKDSDEYFFSRPVGSRIGAWSSPQSQVIMSRSVLEENERNYKEKFGDNIPRPGHWGGFVVIPSVMEFWQGRSNRLHDRFRYTHQQNEEWKIERLAP